MAYENLKDNTNAEKWFYEDAESFLNKALEYSTMKSEDGSSYVYDFIGEIARDLGQYHHLFGYLTDKFPELKHIHRKILFNCEANCFFNGKKQNIVPSMAIMNLKSNHGWTDRVDQTSKDEKIESQPSIVFRDFNPDGE
jgi:hypothetical protein